MSIASQLLVWSVVTHMIADWILQNDWMAKNKINLVHPAAWVHGLIHLLANCVVFPFWAALIVSIMHVLIDTRKPISWWRSWFRQTKEGEVALHVAFWEDQVFHIIVLAIISIIVGGTATSR